jgi:hypothetical protein
LSKVTLTTGRVLPLYRNPVAARYAKENLPGNAVPMSATTKQKPITEQLTLRQGKYVRYRLQGYSQRASALKAGYSKHTAQRASIDIEAKPQVQVRLRRLLERRWRKIVRVIDDGLLAERCMGHNKSGEPIMVADHATRLRAAELAAKLGDMGPQTVSVKSSATEPNPFACLTPEELEDQIHQLVAQLGYTLVAKTSCSGSV